jgi:hypothetical protein
VGCKPSPSHQALAFVAAFVFALASLVVIPEGDLLFFIVPLPPGAPRGEKPIEYQRKTQAPAWVLPSEQATQLT